MLIFATKSQIALLNHLSDRSEFIKMRHPSLIPQGLMRTRYEFGLTSEKAGLLIQMYRSILNQCDLVLYPWRKRAALNEDLPA